MNKRIVYTRYDGGVSVCIPTADIFRIMQVGGYWNDRPHGFVEAQIERQIKGHIHPDAARRFAHAVAFGGCSEAEAWAIIRDRDCGHLGRLHELHDVSDMPGDRWFRDAWRRSPNGGPINISMDLARPIQWQKARAAAKKERERREGCLEPMKPLRIAWQSIRAAIRHARDPDELRKVWPCLT